MAINKRVKGTVRRSQLITTYGVGAIVAAGDESFMVAGIDRWPKQQPDLHEPRLERRLGVQGFIRPPASEAGDIPIVRFPAMYSCPQCRRLDRHRFFTRMFENTCGACRADLVPSRFVVACRKGHIDDFPYFEWVHKGTERRETDSNHTLSIQAGGASASLRDVVINCSCGKSSTMYGAFGREALREVRTCTGRRPWLGDQEDCDEIPRTLQRGASNVYFPIVRSALSIPPWSEGAYKVLNQRWAVLQHIPESALAATLDGMRLAEGTPYTTEDLVLAMKQRKQADVGEASGNDDSLKGQEYEALMKGKSEQSRDQDFVCVPATDTDQVKHWFAQVMLVTRLREIRALEGFTRLMPAIPSDPPDQKAPLSQSHVDWLPAVEVLGEGVFLRLDAQRIAAWEALPLVQRRANSINDKYVAKFLAARRAPDRQITPRLLLIHTLAHVLINQWSLESGYPAASLRERLYVSDEMVGLLIYTATTDAAGSLGGVVAQADNGRLEHALQEAMVRASWCSADPLCIEAVAAGTDSLNLAACHGCVLLPEVSCEEANSLLDRGLLVGTPEDSSTGFFDVLLSKAV